MLLRLGHKDKVISIELNQHLLLGPRDLGITPTFRTENDSGLLAPDTALAGFFSLYSEPSPAGGPGNATDRATAVSTRSKNARLNTTPLDTGACKPSMSKERSAPGCSSDTASSIRRSTSANLTLLVGERCGATAIGGTLGDGQGE